MNNTAWWGQHWGHQFKISLTNEEQHECEDQKSFLYFLYLSCWSSWYIPFRFEPLTNMSGRQRSKTADKTIFSFVNEASQGRVSKPQTVTNGTNEKCYFSVVPLHSVLLGNCTRILFVIITKGACVCVGGVVIPQNGQELWVWVKELPSDNPEAPLSW